MKFKLFLFAGLFAFVIYLTAKVAKKDEIYLPFHAELTENFQSNDGSVEFEAGARFIILRPVDNGKLLVEFPRRGVYEIPSSITNAHDEIQKIKKEIANKGSNAELHPRMSYFLANRIISGKSGWKYAIRSDEAKYFTRWILLYGDSDQASTIEAIKIADAYYAALDEDERKEMALVYLDPTGNKANIQSIADTLKPTMHSMPGYLSRGYSKSLAHLKEVEEFPFLIELETTGRVINEYEGIEKIKEFFNKAK